MALVACAEAMAGICHLVGVPFLDSGQNSCVEDGFRVDDQPACQLSGCKNRKMQLVAALG